MMMGSIELARTICEELKGELPDGEQYGSVDIAEILSARVRNIEDQRDNFEALYLQSGGTPLPSQFAPVMEVLAALDKSLNESTLLGNWNEPLDAYGKRIVRAILVEFDRAMLSASPQTEPDHSDLHAERAAAFLMAAGDAKLPVVITVAPQWLRIAASTLTRTGAPLAMPERESARPR
jgi:hypothetical protein